MAYTLNVPDTFNGVALPKVLSGRFNLENGNTGRRENDGAYKVLPVIFFSKSQFELIEEVLASGLRGRGGAGFPTGLKWRTVPRRAGKPIYLVINADEGEPGTFKDRLIMERDPHSLLEGMILAGYALGVRTAYIYVRGEMLPQIRSLNAAIKECYDAGLLGENIAG